MVPRLKAGKGSVGMALRGISAGSPVEFPGDDVVMGL